MRHLDKITIAPQWTVKPGFLDRPVVRLYMTWANWSKAADSNSLMADSHPSAGTHGMIFGVQYETWW
jgi:maltoporin